MSEAKPRSAEVAAALEAGQQALARGDWSLARAEFERALRDEPGAPDVLEGLGWALHWLEDVDRAFEVREEAYRRYRERGDDRAAARLATFIGLDYADFRGVAVTAGWLQRARRLLEPLEEGPEHAWLYLWEGHLARAIEHDLPRAYELAARARAIATRLGLHETELLAIALEGLIRVTEGEIGDGMRQLDEAVAAASAGEMAQLDSIVATCCFLVHACERVRDYERAAAWMDRIEGFSRRWRLGSVFALCETEQAALLIGRGEWDEAERLLERSFAALQAKRPLFAPEARMHLGELRRRQGRIEEAEDLFRETEPRTLAILGLSAIALDRDDPDGAAFRLERLRRRALAEKWVERAWGLEMLVRARSTAGLRREANEALAELEGVAARASTPAIRALADSARGFLRRRSDDLPEARNAFEDALDGFTRCGAPWEAARVRVELAEVLYSIGRASFARQELESARATFRRLGAAADLARVEALLDRFSGEPAVSVGGAGPRLTPLTRREIEVLQLVSRGMSDKEVAAELNLSEHTVHRHVANILGKLDQPSRAAAVARAAREGLI